MNMKLVTDTRGRNARHWLVAEGTDVAVSYANVATSEDGCLNELVEIETRLEFQNHGYATTLLELLREHYSVEVIPCSGKYTLDGYHFVRHLVAEKSFPKGILEPMLFVSNWASMIPRRW